MICTRLANASVRRLVLLTAAVTLVPAASGCNNAGEGAFSGAAIGTLAGLSLGSLSGNAGEGAIVGLVSGALAGGVIGDQNARAARGFGAPTGSYGGAASRGADRMPASQQPVDYFDPHSPDNMRRIAATNAPRQPHPEPQEADRWPDESHVDVDALIERHRQEIERLEELRRELEARDNASGVWQAGADQAAQLDAQRYYGQDTAAQPLDNYYTQQGGNQSVNIYTNSLYFPATHRSGVHSCTGHCGCVYCGSCRSFHSRSEFFSRCATGITVSHRWRAPAWRTSLYYGWCSTPYDWRFRHGFGLSWSSRFGVRSFGTIGWWCDPFDSRFSSPHWRPGSVWHAGGWWSGASFYSGSHWWYSTHHDRHRKNVHASRSFNPTPPRIVDLKRNPTRDRFLEARNDDRAGDDRGRVYGPRGVQASRDSYESRRRAQEAEETHRDRRAAQRPQARDDNAPSRPGERWVSRQESNADSDRARRELRPVPGASAQNESSARPAAQQARPSDNTRAEQARRSMRPIQGQDQDAGRPTTQQRPQAQPQGRRPVAATPERRPQQPAARPAPQPSRPAAQPAPQRPQAQPQRESRRPQVQPERRPATPAARPAPQQQRPQAQPQRSSRPAARPAQRPNRIGEQRSNNNSRRGRGG